MKAIEVLIQFAVFIIFAISIVNSFLKAISKASEKMNPAGTSTFAGKPSPIEKSQRRNKERNEQRQQEAPQTRTESRSAIKRSGLPSATESPRNVGSGIKKHVDTFIGEHVRTHMGRDVDEFVKQDISDRVKQNLGKDAPAAAPSGTSQAASSLMSILQNPEGVKQAIVVSEILSKPKALRRK